MEFPFPVCKLFKDKITKVRSDLVPEGFVEAGPFGRQCTQYVAQVVDAMGMASAESQRLARAVTSGERLRNSDHTLYVMTDNSSGSKNGRVVGFLKTGYKNLYLYDKHGNNHETKPLCVLDFFIHEALQRRGLGRELFDHMLRDSDVTPKHLALDRPSDSFMAFVRKHYGLFKTIPQVNHYAIYDDFFSKRPDGKSQYSTRLHGRVPLRGGRVTVPRRGAPAITSTSRTSGHATSNPSARQQPPHQPPHQPRQMQMAAQQSLAGPRTGPSKQQMYVQQYNTQAQEHMLGQSPMQHLQHAQETQPQMASSPSDQVQAPQEEQIYQEMQPPQEVVHQQMAIPAQQQQIPMPGRNWVDSQRSSVGDCLSFPLYGNPWRQPVSVPQTITNVAAAGLAIPRSTPLCPGIHKPMMMTAPNGQVMMVSQPEMSFPTASANASTQPATPCGPPDSSTATGDLEHETGAIQGEPPPSNPLVAGGDSCEVTAAVAAAMAAHQPASPPSAFPAATIPSTPQPPVPSQELTKQPGQSMMTPENKLMVTAYDMMRKSKYSHTPLW